MNNHNKKTRNSKSSRKLRQGITRGIALLKGNADLLAEERLHQAYSRLSGQQRAQRPNPWLEIIISELWRNHISI